MGLFGFIGDVFKAVAITPITSAFKGITNLVGADPFQDPLKFALSPISAAVRVAGAAVGAGAEAVGLGAGPGPGIQVIGIPVPGQVGAQPLTQPIARGSSSGGVAAFGNFGLSQPGRGNPSWLFSGTSVTSSVAQPLSLGSSLGQWQVSGTSVRLLG